MEDQEIPDRDTSEAANWLSARDPQFDTPTFWLVTSLLAEYRRHLATPDPAPAEQLEVQYALLLKLHDHLQDCDGGGPYCHQLLTEFAEGCRSTSSPDLAPTSPRSPAERLTKDNVLRYWRTCEDGITCMEPAFGRNREEADWVKFLDFTQVVDERDEAYRSASLRAASTRVKPPGGY